MAVENAAQNHLFGELVGLCLHHHDGLRSACNCQVETRDVVFRSGRVEHILAIDVAHTSGAKRPLEGHTCEGEGCGCAEQCRNGRVDVLIVAEEGGDDLHLALEPLGEEGAYRTVNESSDEYLRVLLRHLPLCPATGDAPSAVHLLHIIHPKREEVLVSVPLAHSDSRQHHAVPHPNHHRASSLTCDVARLENDVIVAILLDRLSVHCLSRRGKNLPVALARLGMRHGEGQIALCCGVIVRLHTLRAHVRRHAEWS
mmetsp:Transcript_9916/g.24115  ORF Transcript_9916/g.24115 Transcript_9916/m.24115 type:complete len:256 (-) Transcript_9916:272-1039(-)